MARSRDDSLAEGVEIEKTYEGPMLVQVLTIQRTTDTKEQERPRNEEIGSSVFVPFS